MKISTKDHKLRLLLYLLAVTYYAVIAIWYQFVLSEEVMFFATDSREYREVAAWMLGNADTVHTQTRPLLYPALIAIPYQLAGVYGIWLLQAAAWLLSVDLLFFACYRWTKKYWLSFLTVALFASNVSVIAMSFHALTELLTILGLSLLMWIIARYKDDVKNVRFGNLILLVLLALCLIKPVFFYPFLLTVLMCGVFYFKQYLANVKNLILPMLAIALLLFQMSVVKMRHGSFTVSTISHRTFTEYLFTQGVSRFEKIEFDAAREIVSAMSENEQSEYLRVHFREYSNLFRDNMDENLKGEPVYLNCTTVVKRSLVDTFQYRLYGHLIRPHYWLFYISLILGAYSLFKKKWNLLVPLLIAEGLLFYYVFATGLSFWQGDRLTLPIIAIWPVLYLTTLFELTTRARLGFVNWKRK